jgi:hypothetical protein
MPIEFCCPRCMIHFKDPTAILEQMFDEHCASALGDGDTFEDMISVALTEGGPAPCPQCGAEMQVSEESLSQLALTMLSRI